MKVASAIAAAVLLAASWLPALANPGIGAKPELVEIISIEGEINDSTAETIARQVEKINENKQVKAVVLKVDSPGGGSIASSAIYEELSKIKVPVVGWCNSMCASGGTYALMATSVKFIGIRSETITGSVGVIMHNQRYNRLLDWLKIDSTTFKSGALKDSGSPTRDLEKKDREYLQSIIDELAKRFYAVVAKSRDIKDWDAVKSARIFIGSQGVDVGLADGIITFKEAIQKAKELSGSKLIFTREEIKKMSAMAEEPNLYNQVPMQIDEWKSEARWAIKTLKDIQRGEVTRFEYRMPYQF